MAGLTMATNHSQAGQVTKRKTLLRAFVASVAAHLAASCAGLPAHGHHDASPDAGPGTSPGAVASPNVVVFMVDDLDSASLQAALASPRNDLPRIRELASRGVTFRNSYATTSLCSPSRASFLTGQYAHNHGVLTNKAPEGGVTVFKDGQTLATAMQARGYVTGHIGKYLNGYGKDKAASSPSDDERYVPPGWSDWAATLGDDTYRMYNYRINDNGIIVSYGAGASDYQTDVLAARAEKFIAKAELEDARPFFLTVNPLAVHVETSEYELAGCRQRWRQSVRPAPRHLKTALPDGVGFPPGNKASFNEADMTDKPSLLQGVGDLNAADVGCVKRQYADRLGSLLAVDDMVGRVLDTLRSTGEIDNTVILFTSDNGFFFGEHRLTDKKLAYEEAIRVPLMVTGPKWAGGRASDAAVLNIDLAPTIAALAGATMPFEVDGSSFVPLLEEPDLPGRSKILVEFLGLEDGFKFQAVRTTAVDGEIPNRKYVAWGDGAREYYDLAIDPSEVGSGHVALSEQVRKGWEEITAELAGCRGAACRILEQQGGLQRRGPVASYAPTCTSQCRPSCLSGTEVQALEEHGGALYAGLTSWGETLACVWPGASAQINYLPAEAAAWRRAPDLPPSARCAPGIAPWEQVNDLQSAVFGGGAQSARHLFASVLANEDGRCPGLHSTVFHLDEGNRRWVNTRLDEALESLYGPVNSEVRYLETFSDGTPECPAGRPCVFAFVNPRQAMARRSNGPTVWRGRYDPANPACSLICWDAKPEANLDGLGAPVAQRIVSSFAGRDRLTFGTAARGGAGCADPAAPSCARAALFDRLSPGRWAPVWQGAPADRPGADSEVRGINGWDYPDGRSSLWFLTLPGGGIQRVDSTAKGVRAGPVKEVTLVDLIPETPCSGLYAYQLYLHRRGETDANPVLAVASESCSSVPENSFGRIFYRFVSKCPEWRILDMRSIKNDPSTPRVNEASVRWLQRSPFDGRDLFFGTTDMNSGSASLTARIYRLPRPFEGKCPM